MPKGVRENLEPRFCISCGEVIERTIYPSGRKETPSNYKRRQFCSAACHGRALALEPRQSVSDRIFAKVVVDEEAGCWNWTGHILKQRGGYGLTNVGGILKYVHRVVYEILVGPIPEGLQLDHLCRNPPCCNPSHLEAVTQRENILRGMAPSAIVARTNICQRGHELTPENTYIRPDKHGRMCRACIRMREKEAARRKRAAA